MASYALKYYAEFRNTREQDYRIEIYRRSWSGTPKAIKTLSGCVLEIQGSQDEVTAPIVKTQLRVSFIDAWDADAETYEKWGDWGEFYTPDATLYKIKLLGYENGSWNAIWTGYVTPDSWQEDLGYRTAITITARDNIGHLKDFQFDLTPNSDGLVKISDIYTGAMDVIDFAMDYTIARSGLGPTSLQSVLSDDGVYLHDAYVNAAVFSGMNWYDVLERTLEATGMCLRWIGRNDVEITYLRNMPKMGSPYAAPGYQTLEFYGGNLEFEPAVKQIEESVDFGINKNIDLDILSGITYGTEKTYQAHIDGGGSGWSIDYGVRTSPYNQLSGSSCIVSAASDSINPARFTPQSSLVRKEGDSWNRYAFFPVNYWADPLDQNPPAAPAFYINKAVHDSQMVLRVTFANPLTLISNNFARVPMSLAEITCAIYYSSADNLTRRYWDGQEWVQGTAARINKTFEWKKESIWELEFSLKSCDDVGLDGVISFAIYDMQYKVVQQVASSSATPQGVYARIQSVSIETNAVLVEGDKVTTFNNSIYNVLVNRSPLFGALSREGGHILVQNYEKALFYYPDNGSTPQQYPYLVRFNGQSAGSEVPLPVITHQQILCYRHGAARVLSGRCAPIEKAAWAINSIFRYKGTDYYLQGGTLDFFSGIMESAVLHEFILFDDLWTQTPAYSGSTGYNSSTPASGSSGSGASGGVGTETDPVFTASPAHGITANDIENWNGKSKLPAVSSSDNGKVLKVVSGAWAKGTDSGYVKPSSGIPSSDMTSAVQASLALADSALQAVPSDYKKVVLLASESDMPASPDSDTLYLIPET